ncbi:MAG: HD domain-containing protein [Candidatus Saccharibacteria bacterium]
MKESVENKILDGDIEKAGQAHDYLLSLGRLCVRFAEVERAPRYPSGDRENDAEHSFHLALSATELAADYYPNLDLGLVSQFSIVHDLPESYAGDVRTFGISDEDLKMKEIAEQKATERLLKELPPYTAQLLKRYEEQIEPEARFVRFIDKLIPAIINIMAGDANTFMEDYGLTNVDELNAGRDERTAKLQKMFPEFQFIHLVRELVSKTSVEHVFKDNL